MKKRNLSRVNLFLALTSAAITAGFISKKEIKINPAKADVGNYYSSISDSETGTTLLNSLHSLNASKRRSTPGYNGLRTALINTDVDPISNNFIGFYDNKILPKKWDGGDSWNREHVWPNSKDGDKVEDDAHMIRPTNSKINSERGNKFYGDTASTYDPGQYDNYYRGVAARIVFYAAIADTSLKVIDSESAGAPNMGKLSTLLKWNLEYLPNTNSTSSSTDIALRVEQKRNDEVQKIQGNRNPFIDHPEYACKVWGNTNNSTKAICSGQPVPPPPTPGKKVESISLNHNSFRLNPPDQQYEYYYVDLIPTINPSDAENKNVTWSSSNPAVATVTSNGQVRSVSIGSATITCTAADGSGVTATCSIVVGKGGNGCGGSIIVASSLLFIVASVGTGLVLIKKKKDENDKD